MKQRRIMLVEDYPDHAEVAGDMLREAGYEVAHCSRGEEALGLARRFAPHLVLMDINLPGMSGLAATRLLRSHQDTADIPVLALTAYALPAERQTILAAGCLDVLTKPMDMRAFLARVASIVSGPPRRESAP